MTRPAARPVVRSAIAGRPAPGCSASKPRATGPTSTVQQCEPALRSAPSTAPRSTRSACSPARSAMPPTTSCSTSRAARPSLETVSRISDFPGTRDRSRRCMTPAGGPASAPVWNTASLRTGRSASSTIICSCGTANYTFVDGGAFAGINSATTTPTGCRSHHRPRELSLGWPGYRRDTDLRFQQPTPKRPASAPAFLFGCTAAWSTPALVALYKHSPRMWFFGDSILR